MTRLLATAAAAALLSTAATAAPLCTELGFAGLLANCNKGETIEVTLGAGKPLSDAEGPIVLQSGAYYEMEITSDGSQELALMGPEFFRAVWLDEVVINDLEVRAMAIDSVEFDDAGEMEIGFVAIKPGRYYLKVPGSTGDSLRVDIHIQ